MIFDEELKKDLHVGSMVHSCFYQLRQIRTIRQSISNNATRTLIHSFIVTRVDYCNSVLSGIAVSQTDRFQRILNSAARLVLRIPRCHPVSSLIRDNLHFTGCQQRNGRNSRHCCSLRTPSPTGHPHICKNSVFMSLVYMEVDNKPHLRPVAFLGMFLC